MARWDAGVISSSRRVLLHHGDPSLGAESRSLDECELPMSDGASLQAGQRLETEKYIIDVQGPWEAPSMGTQIKAISKPIISNGMKKVLSRKFRRVETGKYVPPSTRLQCPTLKRRLPLQPGELERRYYEQNPSENQNFGATDHQQQRYDRSNNPPQSWQQRLSTQKNKSVTNCLQYSGNTLQKDSQILNLPSSEMNHDNACPSYQEMLAQKSHAREYNGKNPSYQQLGTPQAQGSLASKQTRCESPIQATRKDNHKSCNAESFHVNHFNPTDFYGEEDEEICTQGDTEFEWGKSISSAAPKSRNPKLFPRNPIAFSDHDENNSSFEVQGALPASMKRQKREATDQTTCSQKIQADFNSGISKNGAMTAQELLQIFGEDTCTEQKSSLSNQSQSAPTTNEEDSFAFVLPQPRESSSSESEDWE
eukprot:CAMPEP_0194263426 /NCGR_PEP_ID=MMETSP0158-20130606/47053_1 /TAXON_ID=33649 /ORGANISM="Thalassionema nitzschioides, Strain L26-B" /LENGTH=422 /DNA_ID=CAMNT_0039003609 /DNA_START=123 /DNA_END=1393 /DNA_ORIENTATION=-